MGIKSSSDIFFIVSVAAVLMAVLSWAIGPMWLAASQWLLVAITVGIWGIYLRLRDMHEGNGKNGKKK
ncbi:MAG: hypothetical protein PHP25_03915 [Candidatus Moranbacteria bacterium]|nr:hypothetical protein [Candidatus Moranbacteria bacterium]